MIRCRMKNIMSIMDIQPNSKLVIPVINTIPIGVITIYGMLLKNKSNL